MFSLSRILCPVDFSDGSRHALDHAVALARPSRAHISALYVHCMSMPVPAGGYPELSRPVPLTDAERSDILQSLRDFVADDRAANASIHVMFEEALSVSPAIVETAAEQRSDLIVLGTHGRTGFDRLVLGSIANRVMKTAACPVLVVPPRIPDAVPLALNRIVCAIDFSPPAARALDVAAALAAPAGARLTVVHVLDLPKELPGHMPELVEYRAARFGDARDLLREAITSAVRAKCAITELVVVGKPAAEIQRIAADQQADLLVIGAHGLGAFDRLSFGTTTYRVAREATCPVLTVRGR